MGSPSWVTQNDAIPIVNISPSCIQTLQQYHDASHFTPFYPPSSSSSFQSLILTIKEILAQDPRASHVRGTTTTKQGENDNDYNILFCHVQIIFRIEKQQQDQNHNNNNIVHVIKVKYIELNNDNHIIIDGIPILATSKI